MKILNQRLVEASFVKGWQHSENRQVQSIMLKKELTTIHAEDRVMNRTVAMLLASHNRLTAQDEKQKIINPGGCIFSAPSYMHLFLSV